MYSFYKLRMKKRREKEASQPVRERSESEKHYEMDVFPADEGDGGYDEALAVEETDNDGDGGDVCRICRSSEKPDDPLRYVCACRGSNYFHEECLRLCLDRHGNKQCEVCRCSYSFVPVYSEKAPERLPCRDSLRGLSLRSVRVAAFPTVGTDEEHDALEDTEAANTLMAKINETVKILSKSKVTNLEKARNDYIEELKADLASLYGFNEFLTGYLVEMFPVLDIVSVFESFVNQLPVHICVNTLLTDKKTLSDQLRERRFILKNFKHMEGVIEVYQDNREGYRPETSIVNTPEHENGYYTVQNASLFLPVLALNPLEEDIVMDMNADSGTNTAYIAARTRNTGDIHANQIGTGTVSPCPKNKRKRSRKLVKYLQGMGVNTSSVSVSQDNEIELRNRIHNSMNLVLLHAPSSQSGIVEKMMQDELLIDVGQVEKCVRLQKKLILRAIDLAKGDSGFIVYSTDSILVEENEAIIDYALKKRSNVQLVHCNLDFGKNGFSKYREHRFDDSLKMTRRFYPHIHRMNGLFVAKLEKTRNTQASEAADDDEEDDEEEDDDEENDEDEDEDEDEENDEDEDEELKMQ